jgi:hypothetical protein
VFCIHGDEYSSSVKYGNILDYLSLLSVSREELCSTELVSVRFP